MSSAHGWTISDACEQFERAGMPVNEYRFRKIITNLPGLRPIGEKRSGPQGGRGQFLYEIGALQQIHQRLAEWLVMPPPGDT